MTSDHTQHRSPRLCLVPVLAFLALAACSKKAAQVRAIACFDATSENTTPSTRAVFAERRCQGGGVTWAALIRVLLERRGRVEPVLEPTPGWTGDQSKLNGRAHFAIDEEADSARFCADDGELLAAVRRDYDGLNTDTALLRKAMREAPALAMECFEVDGRAPRLPALLPSPSLPAAQAQAARAGVARLRETLRQQPEWCFPGDGAFNGSTGALRFTTDDRVMYTPRRGARAREGTLTWPREGSGDDRVQITEPTLLHLDVGDAGRLGRSYTGNDAALVREELIPGDGCLR